MKNIFFILLIGFSLLLAQEDIKIETIDGGNNKTVGTIPTLKIYDNNSYILYGDETDQELKLIKKRGNDNKIIHTITGTSNASNFDIDHSGNIHICYLKNGGIYYDTNKSGTWSSVYVDKAYSSTWTRIGCKVDKNQYIHMSYDYYDAKNKDYQLHYATNKTGSFNIETILDKNTQYSDLAIGKDNKIIISFSDFNNVYIVTKKDNNWTTPILIGGWLDNSIAYDDKYDTEYISYIQGGQLYFAKTQDGSSISSYPINTVCKAQLPYIDIGKDKIGVAYLCNKNDKKYAMLSFIDGKTITIDDITSDNAYWHGEYGISLDFDNKGKWYVVYYDIKNRSLKYATQKDENTQEQNTTSSLEEKSIHIYKNWQNIGFENNLNVNIFDDTCIDYIWKYDISNPNKPIWKLYANDKNFIYPNNIKRLYNITPLEGYWIKSDKDCVVNIENSQIKSKLIDNIDIIDKKLQLLHYNNDGNLDYWFEISFHKDGSFNAIYNDNITDKYETTSEIRDSGYKIAGKWVLKDSKIYLTLQNETIILTPIVLDLHYPIGYEVFKNGSYEKKIMDIQNFY